MKKFSKEIKQNFVICMTFIFIVFLLDSCLIRYPCNLSIGGKVINQATNNPMDSVLVKVYDDGIYFMEFYTDSTGIFSAGSSKSHNPLFGPRCKEVKLEFSKNGFISETYSTRYGGGDVMIYMRK